MFINLNFWLSQANSYYTDIKNFTHNNILRKVYIQNIGF